MEAGGWGGLRDEGQSRALILGHGSFSFPDTEILLDPRVPAQITSVQPDNAADTRGLFPHHTTNTATLSGEYKRDFWASTSPPFV